MSKISILVADDHKIVRMGLKSLFAAEKDLAVVGEADDGAAAVRQALKLAPDVIIMDLVMPKKDGVAATTEIHAPPPPKSTPGSRRPRSSCSPPTPRRTPSPRRSRRARRARS